MTRKFSCARSMITVIVIAVLLTGAAYMSCDSVFAAKSSKPAKATIKSVRASGTKITVKWKKAKNAAKYQVYARKDDGSWQKKKQLKGLSFSMAGTEGAKYSFKVRGISRKNKKGAFSKVKSVTIPKGEEPAPPEETYGDIGFEIIREPKDVTAMEEQQAVFRVGTKGEVQSYQWYRSIDGSNKIGDIIAGADSETLTITVTLKYIDAAFYCVITGERGKIKTRAAKLNVKRANRVYITEQPKTQIVYEGDKAVFKVEANGTGETLKYQWYLNDENSTEGAEKLTGETGAQLVVKKVRLEMDGRYYFCMVRDDISRMNTNVVRLTVNSSPARAALVRDLQLHIQRYGVCSEETIKIDNMDFYVLATEPGRVLVLAKEAWITKVGMMGNWSNNMSDAGGNVDLAAQYYFKKCPTLDIVAVYDTILTPTSRGGTEYKEDTLRAFPLTEADVTGAYEGSEVTMNDFTFDKTEEHIGRALPAGIAKLYLNGSPARWIVRTPASQRSWLSVVDTGDDVAVVQKSGSEGFYLRLAFWVGMSD